MKRYLGLSNDVRGLKTGQTRRLSPIISKISG